MTRTVPDALAAFFEKHHGIAIAFSGGTDSSYLLYAASACGCGFRAYTVETPFRSPVERTNAETVATMVGAEPVIVEVDILSHDDIRSNPENRCYLCKKAVFSTISRKAGEDGCRWIADASNASDDPDGRPGMKALEEMGVLSPLRDAGLTKADIRKLSREAGLPNWNTPSDSCLATRIAFGTPLDAVNLSRTAAVEGSLRDLGFSGIRVRTLPDGTASFEIPDSQMTVLDTHRNEIDVIMEKAYGSYSVCRRIPPAEI